ncbi:DNA polymerase III subunit delta, partial [Streptomyces asiaticus]
MARKTTTDDPLAPVTLAVGQEELLLDRAVQQVVAGGGGAPPHTAVGGHMPHAPQPRPRCQQTPPTRDIGRAE